MNIKELTMQAIRDEREKVEMQAQSLTPLGELALDLPGVESSTTLGSGGLLIFCHTNDWRPAYRVLRQASGQRPSKTSVYPDREPSTRASVNLDFPFGETRITLNFSVSDYRQFIKPGANCRRESMSDRIVCA